MQILSMISWIMPSSTCSCVWPSVALWAWDGLLNLASATAFSSYAGLVPSLCARLSTWTASQGSPPRSSGLLTRAAKSTRVRDKSCAQCTKPPDRRGWNSPPPRRQLGLLARDLCNLRACACMRLWTRHAQDLGPLRVHAWSAHSSRHLSLPERPPPEHSRQERRQRRLA